MSLAGELAGSLGADFTPREIIVCPGEDVAQTILSLAHDRRQTIYVLSGTGSITNISLKHGGGRSFISLGEYKILSLSGEFIPISFVGTGYIMKFLLQATLEAADGTEIKDYFSVYGSCLTSAGNFAREVVVGGSITSFEVSSPSSTTINSELTAAMRSCELAGSLGADFMPNEIIVCPGEVLVELDLRL